jgi:hypothetical protein
MRHRRKQCHRHGDRENENDGNAVLGKQIELLQALTPAPDRNLRRGA